MSRSTALGLDTASYQRHALHAESRAWVEKNCYIDVWLEVLHAAKLDPTAALAFTVASDFDGDQWTFYKPPHVDLSVLYGVGVQELNVWKPILEHALFHVGQGRLVFTEADAFWLPDTAGTDYRTQHTKSTIVIESIDVLAKKLGYFHNAGYFQLEGEDFVKTFRLDAAPDPTFMPLFAELVKLDRAVRLPDAELAARSQEQLKAWLSRRPTSNPIRRFGQHFARELEDIRSRGINFYHAFAFATTRQCGSGYELSAAYLRWLEERAPKGYETAARAFDEISSGSKAMILKGARAANSKKPVDFEPVFEEMAKHWDTAMATLDAIA
ncbi:MAG TPA: DUF1839 family protein [Polyangiaceae bacterium]